MEFNKKEHSECVDEIKRELKDTHGYDVPKKCLKEAIEKVLPEGTVIYNDEFTD